MLSSVFLLVSSLETCDNNVAPTTNDPTSPPSEASSPQPMVSITLSYAALVAYSGTYSATMAWASVELSRASTDMNEGIGGRQSILFGVNGFMSLLLASVVQSVVVALRSSARNVLMCCVVVLAVGGLSVCVMFVAMAVWRTSGNYTALSSTPLHDSLLVQEAEAEEEGTVADL